jgi:aspartate ammonia-lyase
LTVEQSVGLVTALNPYPGYATAATAIAQEALATGKGAVWLVLKQGLLTEAQLEELLSPQPGTP